MSTAAQPTLEEMLKQIESYPFLYSDGEPMDSPWHRNCMNLLISSVLWLFRDREDFFVGGNMFVYFSPRRLMNRDFRGPDVFVVNGGVALLPERLAWISWAENHRLPDAIIELTSPTTEHVDRTTKFQLYEQTWRTRNYFIYDPETLQLDGWERDVNGHYQPLSPNKEGRLWCAELGVWLGSWEGEYHRNTETWLRFFDEDGELVPSLEEAAVSNFVDAQRIAKNEKQRADDAERSAAARRRKTPRRRGRSGTGAAA